LAPLRRFLGRRVGRPWNAVYSEITASLRLDSVVQKHVLDHLFHFVEVHATLVKGAPHALRYGGPVPLESYRAGTFYVCPKTGLLRLAPARKRPRRGSHGAPPP